MEDMVVEGFAEVMEEDKVELKLEDMVEDLNMKEIKLVDKLVDITEEKLEDMAENEEEDKFVDIEKNKL